MIHSLLYYLLACVLCCATPLEHTRVGLTRAPTAPSAQLTADVYTVAHPPHDYTHQFTAAYMYIWMPKHATKRQPCQGGELHA